MPQGDTEVAKGEDGLNTALNPRYEVENQFFVEDSNCNYSRKD